MASNLTDYAEAKLLDHILGTTSFTMPTTPIKVALFTTTPSDAGTGGVEVATGAYARTTAVFSATSVGAGTTANSGTVTFPTATADWGVIVGAALYDSAGTPNMLFVGPLSASKTVSNGDTFSFAIGAITLSLA